MKGKDALPLTAREIARPPEPVRTYADLQQEQKARWDSFFGYPVIFDADAIANTTPHFGVSPLKALLADLVAYRSTYDYMPRVLTYEPEPFDRN